MKTHGPRSRTIWLRIGVVVVAGLVFAMVDQGQAISERHRFVDAFREIRPGMDHASLDRTLGRTPDHVCEYGGYRVVYYLYPATRVWRAIRQDPVASLPRRVDDPKDLPWVCEGEGTIQVALSKGVVVGKQWQCDSGMPRGDPAAVIAQATSHE